MRSKLKIFLHFLLFLFTAEDSSQWYAGPHIHATKNEVANKVKYEMTENCRLHNKICTGNNFCGQRFTTTYCGTALWC